MNELTAEAQLCADFEGWATNLITLRRDLTALRVRALAQGVSTDDLNEQLGDTCEETVALLALLLDRADTAQAEEVPW